MPEICPLYNKQPNSGWINYKDRLPGINQDTLVCLWDLTQAVGTYTGNETWRLADGISVSVPYISHWMPLPVPPKKEEN